MSGIETIGVDLGGTKALVGVLDEERNVLWQRKEASTGHTQNGLVEMLVREIGLAQEACPGARAIGLGIPATINQRTGVAVAAANLPISELPIRDLITERTGLPVVLDNDANVAIFAEHLYGAARGTRNAVMLTIGTGIGGGLILGGQIFRGTTGAAPELGHTVIELDGPPCQGNCPGRGHVETLGSGTALGLEGRDAATREPDSALGRIAAEGGEIDGRVVTEAAMAGDQASIDAIALIGRRIGAALTSFANIFEPEVMLLGGGVMAAGDLLLEPAREEVRANALPPMDRTPVRAAEMGPDAGMVGAAAMARIELGL